MAVSDVPESLEALTRVVGGEGGGGYRRDLLLENLSDRDELFLICSRCGGITRDACTVSSGEQVCGGCTNKEEQSLPNTQVRNTVAELKSRCPLSESGCKWSGGLKGCETHLETCSYFSVKCQLGCGALMSRADEQSHVNETCVLRTVACEHCSLQCVAREFNEHSGICAKAMVECDLGCGETMRREHVGEHLKSECDEGEVTCPFERYGCSIGEVTRKELKPHLTEAREQHTDLRMKTLEDQVLSQSSHIEYLTKKVVALENYTHLLSSRLEKKATLNWEISNMVANLNFQTIILKVPSSPVLSVAGYQLKLGWWVEGDVLSIDLYSITGEEDDALNWPFKGNCRTRFICDMDPANRSLEVRKTEVEVSRKLPTTLSIPGARIASVNKGLLLARGFMRRESLRLEICLKSLNPI